MTQTDKADRETMGILPHTIISEELLRKKYKEMALRLHPDRNRLNPNAVAKFQELGSAYERLNDSLKSPQNTRRFYMDFVERILRVIQTMCEEKVVEYLHQLDEDVLIHIERLLYMNREVLPEGCDFFLGKIGELIRLKGESHSSGRLIVSPTMKDLIENNLYRHCANDHILIIPMWHHELVFDISGSDFYVECLPILPEGCTIDENNDVFLERRFDWLYVIKQSKLLVKVCDGWEFEVDVGDLRIMKEQVCILRGCGISRINTRSMYDISKRGDIYLKVILE